MELSLRELSDLVGGRLEGDGDLRIRSISGIEDAAPGECTFLGHERYLPQLQTTEASAVILREGVACPVAAIRVDDPYLAFLTALGAFAPPRKALFPPGVHATAVVDPSAELGEGVHVGAHAMIGPGCSIGDRSIVGASCVLLADVTLGQDALLYPLCVVREGCVFGDRVVVHSGAVIGSDGFGYARQSGAVHKIPQIGHVVVEDDVEIGANVCIDRATAGRTVIASGVKLDNLVQIGHNVRIGARTAISAQTGISGSTTVGSDTIMGGQVGLADHLQIGNNVRLGGKSGVSSNVPDGATEAGFPSRDHRQWRRLSAHFGRLERYAKEIKQLRRRLDTLEGRDGGSTTEND